MLNALPKSAQRGAKAALAEIWNAQDKEHAEKAARVFGADYGTHGGRESLAQKDTPSSPTWRRSNRQGSNRQGAAIEGQEGDGDWCPLTQSSAASGRVLRHERELGRWCQVSRLQKASAPALPSSLIDYGVGGSWDVTGYIQLSTSQGDYHDTVQLIGTYVHK